MSNYQALLRPTRGIPRPLHTQRSLILKPRYDEYRQALSILESSVKQGGLYLTTSVKDYDPNDVTVRIVDNTIVVEGKDLDRRGNLCRYFIREYTLPKGIDKNEVNSSLSPEGILTIQAPAKPKQIEMTEEDILLEETEETMTKVTRKSKETKTAERIISIHHTDKTYHMETPLGA